MNRATVFGILLCCFTIAGCLPSSCKRVESRELFASDSLSRQLALEIPEDTLTLNSLSFGSEEHSLEYPRSIAFDSLGTLWVGDVANGNVLTFGVEDSIVRIVANSFELPFIVGSTTDSVYVFDAAKNSISVVSGTGVISTTYLTGFEVSEKSVRYASVSDSGYVLKVVPEEGAAQILFFDESGELSSIIDLPGAAWQWAGFLRKNQTSIASLRGYQPRIDIIRDGGRLDSLELVGFDSPMLARMRSFMRDDANAPPLLTPSAAFVGNRLFVLNIRPGWTRVDVYDAEGRLTDALIRENPSFNKDFFPTDIAVMQTAEQTFLIAVAYVEPDGRIETYEWTDITN